MLPREKGSSIHDLGDAECRARAGDEPVRENAECYVCLETVKEMAGWPDDADYRWFLDRTAPRVLGS